VISLYCLVTQSALPSFKNLIGNKDYAFYFFMWQVFVILGIVKGYMELVSSWKRFPFWSIIAFISVAVWQFVLLL
jgi:hypothetical protein